MLLKIWAKKGLECTFSCQKGAFKQGHSGVRLGLLVFFGKKVFVVYSRILSRVRVPMWCAFIPQLFLTFSE